MNDPKAPIHWQDGKTGEQCLAEAHKAALAPPKPTGLWRSILGGVTVSAFLAGAFLIMNTVIALFRGKSFRQMEAKDLFTEFDAGLTLGSGIMTAGVVPLSDHVHHQKKLIDQSIGAGYSLLYEKKALEKEQASSHAGRIAAEEAKPVDATPKR